MLSENQIDQGWWRLLSQRKKRFPISPDELRKKGL
jgi:hypothetical protein